MRTRLRRWTAGLLGALLLAACAPATPPTTAPEVVTPAVTASSPSPEPTIEAPIPRAIPYDHYLIPAVAEPLFDDVLRAYYRRLVDAMLKGEKEFTVDPEVRGRDDAWIPSAVLSQLNPLGSLGSIGFTPDGKTQIIDYYFGDDHARMVAAIAPRVEELVAQLLPLQANEVDAALAVHAHLARTTDYTQEGPLTGPYGVLVDSSGMCVGFATGGSWLLAQAGFDISDAVEWSPDAPEVEGHAWSLVLLDGEYYHLDATWENGENLGQRLTYFGLTEEQRLAPGALGPFAYVPLLGDLVKMPTATDERFAPLQQAAYFAHDPVRHIVELYDPDGALTLFSTETLTLVG